MPQLRNLEWIRHAPTPSVRRFAVLASLDAISRSFLLSVFPLALYRVKGDAGAVSEIYFLVGITALICGLLTPWLTRYLPRRWTLTLGVSLYLSAGAVAVTIGDPGMVLALLLHTMATMIVIVCLNAYILDYVPRLDLGRCETARLFYSAIAWAAGPVCGVWLMAWWAPAPFIVSAAASSTFLVLFWWMRLGNGKLVKRAGRPAPNPLFYIGRFIAKPRLVAGWFFAVMKSCGWWVYIVYLPIFAVENGLRQDLGGIVLSISNGLLFATPLMLRWMQRHSVRRAVRTGFLLSGTAFVIAALVTSQPWLTIGILMLGSAFMVLLDISAGLPFLMAVKPSERTEMSAVYSSYSNVSGILTPGIAWLVLLLAPLPGIFAATGIGLWTAWAVAGRLHPRLGKAKSGMSVPLAAPSTAAPGSPAGQQRQIPAAP